MSYVVLVPDQHFTCEIEIKRSRFIGHARRVETEEQARCFLDELRAANREARHVCHAFVLGAHRRTQRFSDDGEPSGTAGAPIRTAITARQTSPGHTELSDVVVGVVRYFGGVKLGTGGLVQAYSQAATETLDAGDYLTRRMMRKVTLNLAYDQVGRIENILRAQGIHVSGIDYGAQAKLHTWVDDDAAALDAYAVLIAELTNGQINGEPGESAWVDVG